MKKIFRFPLYMAMGALLATSMAACSDSDDDDDFEATREAALKPAVVAFVNNTVISTYTKMADASMELYTKCQAIQSAYNNSKLTSDIIVDAGKSWNKARIQWELSEAFLFGVAGEHGVNVDGHIDTWPVAKSSVDNILNNASIMAEIKKKGAAGLPSEEGVLGFHGVEALLFQLNSSGDKSEPHTTDYSTNEVVYLVAIAEDLMNQCILLEAYWTGVSNITNTTKKAIANKLTFDHPELMNYGSKMINAGSNETYKNYLGAAQAIIQGYADIAEEVGNQKIGKPVNGASEDDKKYIESPYSLNSIADFTDNIQSIKNAYQGTNSGDASVSDYIKSVDPKLDKKVKDAIQNALDIIGKIPEPFAKSAPTNSDAKKAITVVGKDLVDVLGEAFQALSKN